jgi:hypothetical protein
VKAAISGYRQLSPTEQALMNEAKEEGEAIGALVQRVDDTLPDDNAADVEALANARARFKEGFMWLCRAIAKPTTFALVLLLALLSSSCHLIGGKPSVVASVATFNPSDPGARPEQLSRYDGNTLVAWASVGAQAEVFLIGSWLPIAGPWMVEAGTMYVHVHEPPFEWHGNAGATLPVQGLVLFRPAEIASWGLAPPPTP